MVIFDVYKKTKLEDPLQKKEGIIEDPLQQKEETIKDPIRLNEDRLEEHFNETFGNKNHFSCYKKLKDLGFPTKQAYNCANSKETTDLFWTWHFQVQSEINSGSMSKMVAKGLFFRELKANNLKI